MAPGLLAFRWRYRACMDEERPPSLGLVVTDDRGSLPFLLVHGEALAAAAAWAMGEAEVSLVDASVTWEGLADAGEPVVLHDSLCPLTPPAFLAACVDACLADGVVVVGVRPVTDTIKQRDGDRGDRVGRTLDRDELRSVCSPIVLPAHVVADVADDGLPTLDFAELAALLRQRYDVRWEEAPPQAGRVASADDVRLLEALDQPLDEP